MWEIDPNLVLPPKVVIASSGSPRFPQQLNGFDFGPDGMLYAPQPCLGRIVRINPDTGAMTLVTDEFAGLTPSSVEFDHHGQLYVSLEGGTVVRLDPNTGAYTVVAQFPHAGIDNMVLDARDRLYVSNNTDGSIFEVAPGGGVRTLNPGGLILPAGVALMAGASGRDSLFVADAWSLGEFDPISGRLLSADRQSLDWMHPGLDRSNAGIMGPWTVAPDNGNLILTNWLASAVQIWNPTTHQAVAVHTEFPAPLNAIRFQGDLVVAQFLTHSLVRETSGGTKSTISAAFTLSAGLAATNGDLWVSDRAKVWKVVSGGTVLNPPQLTAQGLQSPEGMAVDRDGSLLVVEAGAGRLSRVDPATGDVTTVADGLDLGLQGAASPRRRRGLLAAWQWARTAHSL